MQAGPQILKKAAAKPLFFMKKYSIIISVYNEINTLHRLLTNLKPYFEDGHELLIIDDGSNDGSKVIIKNKHDEIKLHFKKQC